MNRMTALVKTEPGPGMELREVPVPEPDDDEVRLRVKSVGIDGGAEAMIYAWHPSKRHYEEHLPQIFGHEFSGVVDAVGSDVTRCEEGDRVAVEPGISCLECRNCRAGDEHICQSKRNIGLDPDIDGAFAEYVTVPARYAYGFDESVSFDEGMFVELLGLGVHAIERSNFAPGDRVAVTGPGSVGMGVLAAAKAAGAKAVTVIGAEPDREVRLPIAERMGATETATIGDHEPSGDVDLFVDASGSPSAVEYGIEATRPGGEMVQIGVFHDHETVPVEVNGLIRKGIDYKTVLSRRDSTWRRSIEVASEMDLSPVIGPTFDFEDYEAAFEAFENSEGIKIALHP